MPTVLRVKNDSDEAVVVELDDGSASSQIEAGQENDLRRELLLTQSFNNLLNSGVLRFVFTPLRSPEQASLAHQLMPRTLRVRNESGGPVTLQLDNQSDEMEIAPDAEVDLEERFLLTRSFTSSVEAGDLSFVLLPSPNNEQYNLSRRLMPRLLAQVGSPLIQLHSRSEAAVKTMRDHRDVYNKSWDATETILTSGEDSAQAADFLSQGIEHFLNVDPEEALVEQLQQEIEELENEDLDETGRSLTDWFIERDQKQAELEKAEAKLAQAQQEYKRHYQLLSEKLKASANGLSNIDSGQDIGQKLDTNW